MTAAPNASSSGTAVAWQFRQRSGVGKGPQGQAPWGEWCGIERETYDMYVEAPNKLIEVRALYASSPTPQIAGGVREIGDEPRDALGQTASEVYSSDFAPPTVREALEDLLKDIDESHALGMPVLLRRDTIAEARAALALSPQAQAGETYSGQTATNLGATIEVVGAVSGVAQGQSERGDLTKLAAECHRAKWQFDLSEDYKPTAKVARAMILKAFDELHRIGDVALKLRDASSVPSTEGK